MKNLPNEDSLVALLEQSIVNRTIAADFSEKTIEIELEQMGKSPAQIHELLIELDDEWKKEQLAIKRLKKNKKKLVLSIFSVILIGTFMILSARYPFLKGRSQLFPFILIGAILLTVLKAYDEIRKEKKRKKRRLLKWEIWT